MSLNVALTSNMNKGIDTASLKAVTQAIFQRAESKTAEVSTLDFSKFKSADLGMYLYSGRVDASVARQVAMTNSGIQVNLNQNIMDSVKFLNSEASKVALKNMDGKVNPTATSEDTQKTKNAFQLPKFTQLVKTSDLGQDKRGSNPFYKGELLKTEKKEKEESINIFA